MNSQLINIILLAINFMILFIAFQTTTMLSENVWKGIKNDTKNETDSQDNSYISQAILHVSFAIVNIFAPVIVSIIGSATSMFFGAITYLLCVISYIYPMNWSYYIVTILIVFGTTLLWNGQGVYLSIHSDDATISRNSGIFWSLFQMSFLPGNIYICTFLKTDIIDRRTRYSLFTLFSFIGAFSLILFIFLIWRSNVEERRDSFIGINETKKGTWIGIGQTLKISGQLLITRNILLLLILFTYMGLSFAFFMNVYSTCIGHYKKYGDSRKRLIGLHGILLSLGEILGGGLFGFITRPRTSSQRAFIVLIGFVLQIIFYYLVFINIPLDASAKETDSKPYINFSLTTSQVITFIGSFIVGLGDSSLNTQLMNVLGSRYKETTASAFAIFKLVQALGAAIAFFYAGSVELQWQLLILIIFLFFGTMAFFLVLFDDASNRISIFVAIHKNHTDNINYQYSIASSFG